jgi:hypothetical protein
VLYDLVEVLVTSSKAFSPGPGGSKSLKDRAGVIVILNGYEQNCCSMASSVDLKWVLISLASHRLSNNLDNGDDDLRSPCVKESCKAAGNQERGASIQSLALQSPSKEAGGVIFQYRSSRISETTRLAKFTPRQSPPELPVEKETRRESLTALRRAHAHDLGRFLSQPTFRWYEHIARIALSLVGQYGLCYIPRMVYLRFF